MILKGSQRANGADLAVHLLNAYDNERIEVAEVHGTVADDLYGAFAEFEAVAAGTRATKPLYSLSINPPEKLTREQYAEAIDMIEKRLGLTGQPRAIVFHHKTDKDGQVREHCHVVWSRIDAEKMRAIHMAHDHRKLCDLACDLAHKYGLDLPPGLKAWDEKRRFKKEALEPTLGEKAQQEATGISPEQRRAEITAAFEQSDNTKAFINALEQKGYVLAAGSRRGFVVVDKFANVHSLSRYVKGHSAKQIRARLAPLTPEQLPSVDEAKEIVRQRKQAQDERQREQKARDKDRLDEILKERQEALDEAHQARRADLAGKEQDLLIRQQHERLTLEAAQKLDSERLGFRARRYVAELIAKTPVLRSVLGPDQKITGIDPRVRQVKERTALARRHERERADIARSKRLLAKLENRERQSLEKAAKRDHSNELRREFSAGKAQHMDNRAMQDFYDAARDLELWKEHHFEPGDLYGAFNEAAGIWDEFDGFGGDDDHMPAPDLDADDDADDHTRGFKPSRGRGYGYRRDDD